MNIMDQYLDMARRGVCLNLTQTAYVAELYCVVSQEREETDVWAKIHGGGSGGKYTVTTRYGTESKWQLVEVGVFI